MGKNMKNIICTICARGGSEGVKGKNIRLINNKPLLAYTIEQAIKSELFECIAVSSDSEAILEVAATYGADFLIRRPNKLATSQAPKLPVIRHCVEEVEKNIGKKFEVCVDLDATSPLRCINDIRSTVSMLEDRKVGNIITASPARRSPYFNLIELRDDGVPKLSKPPLEQINRRQDSPQCFDMNASIYVWRREKLFSSESLFSDETRLYVMPEERSIDIDSEFDFKIVSYLL